MKQRQFIPLLLAGLLLVLLSGAQAIDAWHWQTAGAQSPPTPSDSQAAIGEITTLRWFTRWDAERLNTVAIPLLAQFHAEQPTIRVLVENVSRGDEYYQQLRLQLDRGQPPDIFYPATHIAYDLQQRGQLLALDSFIRRDGLDLTAYAQAPLQLYGDATAQLYCLPVDVATLAVFYNRALFDAAGVAYPQAPWTWEDLLVTAAQLTADDGNGAIAHYGVDRFYTYWPLLVWSATGHNVFDQPQHPTAFLLEEEASVKAVQWLADLHLEHGVMPPVEEGTDGENLFLAGRAAMQITGYWQIPSYRAAALDIDVVPLPIGEYAVNRSDGSCLALAAKSERPQAAWTFLKFLAGPTGIGARMAQAQQAQSPAITALNHQSFFINPLNLPTPDQPTRATPAPTPPLPLDSPTQVTFPLYDPLHPLFAEWHPIVERELRYVWRGQRSADTAIGRMANAAEDLLEDLPVPDAPALQTRQATKASMAPAPSTTAGAATARANSVAVRPPLSSTIQLTGTVVAALSAPQSMTAEDTSILATPDQLPRHYFVAPTGDNAHSGLQATVPWATIQHALDHVQAGDTVHLAAGDYFENLTSVTAGRAGAPITLMGPPDAVLRGAGDASAAFYLTHDYYTLTGFTIDGLFGDPETKEGYTQKLLYVQGKGVKSGVTGLRVLHMRFQNAGGECLRLRYFAQHNEIAYSTFQVCGLLDFVFAEGGKNGEAIYIGTAAVQWKDGKNPTADPDESHHNWVHHNVIDTRGNECVEIKEGGYANLIEHNLCTGQLDPDSAGIVTRGNDNIIRYNTIYSNVGAGVRLGGHEVDDIQYGVNNDVYGNSLLSNIAGGVKIVIEPQNRICGNRLERNMGKQVFGEGSDHYEPAASC